MREGESKRAGRPSSLEGARDVCSNKLKASADPLESMDRSSRGGERTGDGGGLLCGDDSIVRYESTDGWTSNCPKASSWTSISMTVPKFAAKKLRIDAGRSRKNPPGKPSIFNVRVPTADVADFGRSTGKAGGLIVGAALGVAVVEAMVWRWWWSSVVNTIW